ncbi:hypothetical protein ACE6H2_016487 [Prunus campanulata]
MTMALEALTSNEPFNFIIYDTISATPYSFEDSSGTTSNFIPPDKYFCTSTSSLKSDQDTQIMRALNLEAAAGGGGGRQKQSSLGVNNNNAQQQQQQGRKKRRRKPRVCKNKEEAETQRMTHIAVERNRRKQMNEHLAILRSLMPDSYVQRGDQASIVGGAIEFVKELEHLLHSLEAQKLQLLHNADVSTSTSKVVQTPFAQLLECPQYTWSHCPNKFTSKTKAAIADIEVTLIETHANLKIMSRRISPRQLSKLVGGIQSLQLTILHLTVTTMDPFVLYSISVKIEEGCLLSSVDDIATAIHHMLRVIEEAATLC